MAEQSPRFGDFVPLAFPKQLLSFEEVLIVRLILEDRSLLNPPNFAGNDPALPTAALMSLANCDRPLYNHHKYETDKALFGSGLDEGS